MGVNFDFTFNIPAILGIVGFIYGAGKSFGIVSSKLDTLATLSKSLDELKTELQAIKTHVGL
jgi:hypothetical protein